MYALAVQDFDRYKILPKKLYVILSLKETFKCPCKGRITILQNSSLNTFGHVL